MDRRLCLVKSTLPNDDDDDVDADLVNAQASPSPSEHVNTFKIVQTEWNQTLLNEVNIKT